MKTPLNIEFVKLEQTCTACPSQWDAWDADGIYYYIRFRHGELRVDRGTNYETILEREDCDGDGFMDTDTMLEYIGCKYAET